jgi:hypothetical protein
VRRTAAAAIALTIRYLFYINPGRSGSDYLAGLLARARNAVGVHEGVPVMSGRPMRRFNDGDDRELLALMPAKLRAIHRRARPGQVYCETNHSFIKGWGYLLLNKAEAVARLPPPGSDAAVGPFASMTLAELKRVAEVLLGATVAVTSAYPILTQDREPAGDSQGPTGTKGRRKAAA